METVEEPVDDPKKPGATLTEHFKKMKKWPGSKPQPEKQREILSYPKKVV